MKVDNPRFEASIVTGTEKVLCADCPMADEYGWAKNPPCAINGCPTAANYQEQCRLAEQANKGEKDAG